MKETPAERIAELDTLRGIAITAVVGLHVTWDYLLVAPLELAAGKTVAALHLLTGFGVPLFIVVSGIGLALRYAGAMGVGDYADFLRRRAYRILPAYVAWSAVTAVGTDPALLWPVGRLASLLLTGNAGPQFYFIPLIFEFYLLWPLLGPLASLAQRSAAHATAVAVAGTALSMAWWKLSGMGLVISTTVAMPAFFLLYIGMGLAIAPWLGRLRPTGPKPVLVAAMAVVATATFMSLSFFGMLNPPSSILELRLASTIFRPASMLYIYAAMALFFLVAFSGRKGRVAVGLATLGRHSYGIFLIHLLLLPVAAYRLLGAPAASDFADARWLMGMAGSWGVCLALSYAATRALSRLPGLRILVGAGA